MSKITGDGNGSVDPTDLEHLVKRLERGLLEAYRRMAIYEKRILILEGKRTPNRADDAAEWDGGVTFGSLQAGVTEAAERNAVTPDVTPVTGDRNANAERQRRYREKQRQLPRPDEKG